MSDYAQIPTHLICRFGELTKTEIVVFCYLFTARNRKTGQCNPSRSAIARAVSIDRAHVSPAVKSLEIKGWVVEMEDGNFVLASDPEKPSQRCADSAQGNVTESAQGGVRIPQQGCAESVTKVCGIGNTQYKDSSEQRNEQKNEQKGEVLTPAFGEPPPLEHPAVVLYEEKFCVKIGRNFAKAMAGHVTDLGVWKRLLTNKAAWADKPLADRQKIGNWILSAYDEQIARENQNGTCKKTISTNGDKGSGESTEDALRRIGAVADL